MKTKSQAQKSNALRSSLEPGQNIRIIFSEQTSRESNVFPNFLP